MMKGSGKCSFLCVLLIRVVIVNFFFELRRPGGDRIYGVFDNQLPAALKKLPFDRHLSLQNVRKVVSEADGYQPHLIAPEQGYRRLIESALSYFKGPSEASVDAVLSSTSLCLFSSRSFFFFFSDKDTLTYTTKSSYMTSSNNLSK